MPSRDPAVRDFVRVEIVSTREPLPNRGVSSNETPLARLAEIAADFLSLSSVSRAATNLPLNVPCRSTDRIRLFETFQLRGQAAGRACRFYAR